MGYDKQLLMDSIRIDLGHQFVAAAFITAGELFSPDGIGSFNGGLTKRERLVGHEAKRQAVVNPHTIYS
jgi:molecular chaperone DnaK (HSP70)